MYFSFATYSVCYCLDMALAIHVRVISDMSDGAIGLLALEEANAVR